MKFISISLYNFFCSLRLAVFTLSVLIILFAIGTFYESAQGRQAAQELIYGSIWMSILLFLLALNIIAVMIDRWPWKTKHTGFLMAHFGIIFLIVGSFMTRFYGVDGNMRLALGESGGQIITSSVLLQVYSSFDAKNLSELYRKQVHFFRHPPSAKKPLVVPLGSDVLKISNFYPSATAREKYEPSQRGGPALRFQIEGSQMQMVKWLFKNPWLEQIKLPLGPAQVILFNSVASFESAEVDRPSLLLAPSHLQIRKPAIARPAKSAPKLHSSSLKKHPETDSAENEKLRYELRRPDSKKILRGFLKKGSVLQTGWMDLQFRLIDYIPKALPHTIFTPRKKRVKQANLETTSQEGAVFNSAIQVEFKGEKRWMGLNSHLFFFDEDKVYAVAYVHEKKKLGFRLKLKDFKVIRWPSSFKAAGYESQVQVNEGKSVEHISMNHPLKQDGYTVYQSGFEEDEKGVPVASVFSINKDPGRFVKYFGSLLIVLGSLILFLRRNYFKT